MNNADTPIPMEQQLREIIEALPGSSVQAQMSEAALFETKERIVSCSTWVR